MTTESVPDDNGDHPQPITCEEVVTEAPLSKGQLELWMIQQLSLDSPGNNLIHCLRIAPETKEAWLQDALTSVLNRNPTLRTTYHVRDGRPIQRISPSLSLDFTSIQCDSWDIDAFASWCKQESDTAFDLTHSVCRALLLRNCPYRRDEPPGTLLMLTVHHIAADLGSMLLFHSELDRIYQHGDAFSPVSKPTYIDFVNSEKAALDALSMELHRNYWRTQLESPPLSNQLIANDRYDVSPNGAFANLRVDLPDELSSKLRDVGRRSSATPFATLLAGLFAFCHNYTQQTDIIIGTPLTQRTKTFKDVIGYFTTLLPIRISLEAQTRFPDLVKRVRDTVSDARRHIRMPLGDIHRMLGLQSSGSQAPMFQISFSWNRTRVTPRRGQTGESAPFILETLFGYQRGPDQELTVSCFDDSDGLVVVWIYDANRFTLSSIERIAGHFQNLLEGIVSNPEALVSNLPLLTASERRQVVEVFNRTEVNYPRGCCIHQLFEAQVARHPEATALVFEHQSLTYSQLNARANQLAHYLRSLGVGPDMLVALCVERSLEMVIGLLAILKAGGAYVPIDPTYPQERIAFMLEDANASVVLTQKRLLGPMPSMAGAPIRVDLDADLWASFPETDPRLLARPSDLAYVIYTSGTTGRPKGVLIEHRSVVNMVRASQAHYGLTAGDRILQFASIQFDFAAEEIYPILAAGGTLVLRCDEMASSPIVFLECCRALGITVLDLPTAYWRTLAGALVVQGAVLPPSLRLVIVGGEEADSCTVTSWHQHVGSHPALINSYGPTEATVVATLQPLTPGMVDGHRVSIGRPVSNTRIYILDKNGQPVPIGVTGELHIGGVQVARGYLNRPDLTAEKFIPDPFSSEPGARLYKSGDLARWLPDGNIEYLGRTDFQVKIRGFRIELGEIESTLTQHPEVRDALVLAREDTPGDKRLVAYLVPADSGTPPDVADLRTQLKTSLPDYMVPSAFVMLDSLPLTPNGKVDRKALPAPEYQAPSNTYVAPRTRTEEALAAIFADVLHVDRVGIHDNFFELGGHSLLAVTLLERMRQVGLHVELRTLFSAPTLAALAEEVSSGTDRVVVPPNGIPPDCEAVTPEMLPLVKLSQDEIDAILNAVPGGAANVQDIYPLAPLQEGILFHHLMSTDGDAYILSNLFSMDTRARLEDFVNAIQAVMDRHDILRTAVVWEGLSEPVQVVWRNARLPVEEVVLDPAAGDVAEQLRARFDARHTRINVRQAPLMRAHIAYDSAQDRWLFLVLFHHLMGDHTTLEVIREEAQAHLLGRLDQQPAPMPFRNFVAQARLGVSGEEHERFFRQMLGDIDEPTAPFGLLDVQGDGSEMKEARLSVEANLARRLRERARALRVSAASLFHLAWAQVLARVSGRKDVVFGTVLFGRMQGGEGADRVMGMIINTLPIRIPVGDSSAEASVRQTHVLLTDLMRHEHASLALAQRCSGVPAPAPLFSALFNYRHSPGAAQDLSAKTLQVLEGIEAIYREQRTNYPFTLSVDDLGTGFCLTMQVQEPIDPSRVCGYMHTALEHLVEALETAPETPLHSLEVLTPSERNQVVFGFNQTAADYPNEHCLHELFEAQVARHPEATALVFEHQSLTYSQLNARANQLAHYLRSLGVGPDMLVALCVERSLEMVIGLLAILKAGGAYVPIDPTYPQERIAFMLEDANASVVLTQEHLLGSLPSVAGVLVGLDCGTERWAPYADTDPKPLSSPSNLAYVIYTSGSTGKPKGVVVDQHSVVRLVRNTNYGDLSGQQVFLQFAPLAFDAATFEIWGALLNGHELVVCPPFSPSAEELGLLLQRHRITTLWLTAGVFHLMVDQQLPSLGNLRQLLAGGDVLSVDHIRRFKMAHPSICLINGYGPTENTTFTCCYKVPDPLSCDSVSIGKPIANTQVYILDSQRRPVPMGVAGELHIGGAGLARGYLNRPDLTAEKFIPDPFSSEPGARLYKSGDLARWLPDGNIEYLGRTDFQVKIRGFRIELGEIESTLTQHPEVRDALVLAREDTPGDKRLVAYLVPADSGTPPDVADLRTQLKTSLPDYMVPSAFVMLDSLPLTPNGKVDRKALPAPEYQAPSNTYVAPRTRTEEALAAIFADVLHVDRVGIHDNFFELGGHSLLAVTLLERMRQVGLHVELRTLFSAPTLAALAEEVSSGTDRVVVPPNGIPPDCEAVTPEMLPLVKLSQDEIDAILNAVPGGAANVQDIYPLAPLQEGILFHHLMSTDGDAYILSNLFSMDTRARLEDFVNAIQAVMDRHDILRTAVVWEGLSEPVQVVWRNARLPVEEVVLDPAAGDVAEQLRARFDARHTRINVRQAPLMRAHIAYDSAQDRWLFLVLFHHLMGDHTTLEVIREEAQAHLLGRLDQQPAPMPFRNFVAQARLGVSGEEHERFFRQMLGDIDEPTAPFGLLDVQGDGSEMKEARLSVEANLARRLRERARALRVSAASLFHLAWAQVLARVSGRKDVVFGTVLFGRMQGGEGADRVMGMIINTLPIRIPVGDSSAEASVRQTHVLLTDLMRHEHASLALAQRCSGVPAPAPLFSALFNYRHSPGAAQAPSNETSIAWQGIDTLYSESRTNYPFTLSVDDLGTGFCLTMQVQEPIDPSRVCGYMHTALEHLVEALETAPETPLHSLEVLTPSERNQVVFGFNQTAADYPNEHCLHELFEAQVARTPHSLAVLHEGSHLSYQELNAQSNRLAHHLRELGVKPNERVALCVERGLEMVVGMLAILKAGGAYVPLDPAYPVKRLRYMLEESAPVVILTHGRLDELVTSWNKALPVIDLLAETPAWAHHPESNPDPSCVGLTPDHLAYVMYTSGSTGKPKGAAILHRGLQNLLHWYISEFHISCDDALLVVTSHSFDLTQRNLFSPLLVGGQLHLAREPFDPQAIVTQVARNHISMLNLTPGAFSTLIDASTQGELSNLRLVILGGEPAQPSRLRMVPEPRPEFVNSYGPTECTGVVLFHRLSSDLEEYSNKPVPLGRPVPNSRIYILDAHHEPVPIGVVGEIHIGGIPVGLGYFFRPELTAERFVPDPFSGEGGVWIYKTGDLGKWLPDGTIVFLGRNDFQVKSRGFRVELGEIQSTLIRSPQVREAVVLAREDTPGDKRLVAYLVPADSGTPPDVADLRTQLKTSLPDYMVPSAFVMLDSLPLTPNGKVDRKALPAPEYQAPSNTYVAPRTRTEEALAAIFADVLHVDRVGIHDNFFELGGHSLLATQVVSRIRRVVGAEIPLRQVFATPTLADLAAHLDTAWSPTRLTAIPTADRHAPLPLSFAQQSLFLLDQLKGVGMNTWLMPTAVRLTGLLDIPVLHRAVQEVVNRHEGLRTTFASRDGEVIQVIAPTADLLLQLTDLSDLPEEEREQEALRRAQEHASAGFDLFTGPLIRFALVKLDAYQHIILINVHHIVSDAWSIGVLMRDIVALYAAYAEGRDNPLPPLPIQYADYAAWQRNWLTGDVLRRQIDYWGQQLEGLPPVLTLPIDFPRPAAQTFAGRCHAFSLDASLSERVKSLGQASGATLFMTLASAFSILLARHAGQTDLAIGTTIANRTRQEVEGLIGYFVNLLVLRADLEDNPSFRGLLDRMKRTCLDAYSHQDVPFEYLYKPERSASHSPLFQVMLELQNGPETNLTIPGLQISPYGTNKPLATVDLTLNFTENEGALYGSFEYNTDLFHSETIARMAGHFHTLLEGIVSNPETAVNSLPLMTDAERNQVLATFNDTAADYPRDKCFHELFEEQVQRTPDCIAATFMGEHSSYRDLNRHANVMACHLRTAGVVADSVVGLLAERGLPFLTAILGTFKAGGAYLPFDPNHPMQRHVQLLSSSKVRLVLTTTSFSKVILEAINQLPVENRPQILHLEQLLESNNGNMDHDQPACNAPSSLAYVIYTSGSSGAPKGAMVEQRGMVNHLYAKVSDLHLTSADDVAQTASQCFDISVWQFLSPLLVGGRVHIFPDLVAHAPNALWERVEKDGISILETVPSAMKTMLEHTLSLPTKSRRRLPKLRRMIPTGEALPAELCRQWFSLYPTIPLINAYGPTECSDDVTHYAIHESPAARVMRMPIGRPVSNTRIYILDKNGQPVPIGVTGELHIGGVQVARGYLNRPDLTAEKFIPDPFSSEPGARLYKSGDLARWLPDGNIEYLGRTDFQVKIRGFRIELGEIESTLTQHPEVRDALVLAREDTPGDKRLVAYLVPADSGTPPDVADLRTQLKTSLPDYMVPSAFVMLDSLPLTPNGKVDRKALPAPEYQAPSNTYVAPRTRTEEALAAIFADVLHVDRVGIHDNFFELGGHSLLAVQVTARVQKQFEVDLPLTTIFRAETIEQLAQQLDLTEHLIRYSPLVHLRRGTSSKVPVFCFPGAGGLITSFLPLIQYLGREASVYGLQPRGIDGNTTPHKSVEDLANEHVACIRKISPVGPYRLIGHSFGGWVAFEVARQLTDIGLMVDPVILLDSRPPHRIGKRHSRITSLKVIIEYVQSIERLCGRSLGVIPKDLKHLDEDEQIQLLAKTLEAAKLLPAQSGTNMMKGLVHLYSVNANMSYTPDRPYNGPVYLVQAMESTKSRNVLQWQRFALSIHMEHTSGGHDTMLQEPHVRFLGSIVRKAWELSSTIVSR